MAYEMKSDGMAEVSKMLEKLEEAAPRAASKALYKGAGIMAEEIKNGAESIKTAPFKCVSGGRTRLPSPEEKEIIMAAGAGIAKFDKNGTEVNTSVGYRAGGYADLNGKMKPVPMIANAINSGTSFMQKQPFVRKAAQSGGQKAIQAMSEVLESEFSAIAK